MYDTRQYLLMKNIAEVSISQIIHPLSKISYKCTISLSTDSTITPGILTVQMHLCRSTWMLQKNPNKKWYGTIFVGNQTGSLTVSWPLIAVRLTLHRELLQTVERNAMVKQIPVMCQACIVCVVPAHAFLLSIRMGRMTPHNQFDILSSLIFLRYANHSVNFFLYRSSLPARVRWVVSLLGSTHSYTSWYNPYECSTLSVRHCVHRAVICLDSWPWPLVGALAVLLHNVGCTLPFTLHSN